MSEQKQRDGIKDYADGWITERKGTDVPSFLKVAYLIIAAGAVTYFIKFMFGEVDHETRGVLVKALNAATGATSASGLMYGIVGLIVIYAVILAIFVFGKPHED